MPEAEVHYRTITDAFVISFNRVGQCENGGSISRAIFFYLFSVENKSSLMKRMILVLSFPIYYMRN
jgi:hypothetical protein